jgi:serine/threonine protein phosphatase PrpC
MGLSKKAIEEFKKIYQEEFREEISDNEAQELGESLLSLFKIIYRPISQDREKSQGDKGSGKPEPS